MNSDFILSLIQSMAVAAALGVGLTFLIWYLYRSVYAGLVLVLLLLLTEAAAVSLPYLSIGFSAYPGDIVFLLIGFAAMFRTASLPHYSKILKMWLFLGAVLLGSFSLGLLQFGSAAGVEFRQYYYFWVGTLYFMSFPPSERQLTHIVYLWTAVASVVVLIVFYRWLVHFAGGDTSTWSGIAGTTTLRVVNAAHALFIAQALIMVIYLRLRWANTSWMALLPFLAIAVLILQHRTVWVVTLAGLGAIFYLERKARGKVVGNLATIVAVGFAIALPVLLAGNYLDVVTGSLQASVAEAHGEKSTLAWRVQGWQELLKTWAGLGLWQYLFGSPFGSGSARYITGVAKQITESPHNYYVSTLLRVGLVGVITLLMVYARALVTLFRSDDHPGEFPRRGLLVLLLGQLLFFIGYSPDFTQGVLLGMTLALIAREEAAVKYQRVALSVSRMQSRAAS